MSILYLFFLKKDIKLYLDCCGNGCTAYIRDFHGNQFYRTYVYCLALCVYLLSVLFSLPSVIGLRIAAFDGILLFSKVLSLCSFIHTL